MSGIFGIFNRSGKLIKENIVNTMLDAISSWEPDEHGTCINSSVALGHTMLWNTPEAKYEHLPLEKNAYILTMDARIDNRDELFKVLDLPDYSLEEMGDSEFILAAYEKWGEECPKHLLGDFSFAIWDDKKQQLFCARDHIGIKSFYYYLDHNKFIFSNHLGVVMVHPQVQRSISEKAVGIYLLEAQLIDPELTFYDSVLKLPPASILIITEDNVKIDTYWDPEESSTVHFKSIEEYSERLRELLEESVRTRMRSEYPIASHLSGGLDSSAITIIAARFLHSQRKYLHVFNWIPYPGKGEDPLYHEWGNSIKISEKEHMIHHGIKMDALDIERLYETHDISSSDTVNFWYEHLVQKSASDINVRTILSGWGGDELVSYDSLGYVSGLFWKGKIIRAISVLFSDATSRNRPYYSIFRKFYDQVIIPILPSWVYCRLPKIDCLTENRLKYINPAFRETLKSMNLSKKRIQKIGSRNEQLSLYNYGYLQTRIESWATSGFLKKIEYAYPLLDKRIVEFALGIPENLYRKKGYGRYLFRHAVGDIVPHDICWLNTKHEPKNARNFTYKQYLAQKIWLKKKKKISKSGNKYINIEYLLQELEELKISDPIFAEKEIEKVIIFELSILILGISLDKETV